jgi:hypothetical protein
MEKNILHKDFRREFIELLLDKGYDEEEANKLVSSKYKEKLKKEVVKRLKEVTSLIEKEEYDKVKECLAFLPSGYGYDNNYIDFSYLFPADDEYGNRYINDLGDVINELSK